MAAGAHDMCNDQQMDMVHLQSLQERGVVGDDDQGIFGVVVGAHTLFHRLDGSQIQAGIGLIQQSQPGLEHQQLQDLALLLLAAGEAHV
mgnify:CR=1 FL=1